MSKLDRLAVFMAFAGCLSMTLSCSSLSDQAQLTTEAAKSDIHLSPFPTLNCTTPDQALRELADWQETNLSTLSKIKDPELIENAVRLTSAGLLSDQLEFVELDRDCWAEFFTAFSNSIDKNVDLSKNKSKLDETRRAANAWLTCVEARNPNLFVEAKKIRTCFP